MSGIDLASSGMTWAVRESFVEYVLRVDGEVEVFAPAAADAAGFSWPVSEVVVSESGEKSIQLSGGVVFTAHGGLLRVPLLDLRIHQASGSFHLSSSTGRTIVAGAFRAVPGRDGGEAYVVDEPALHPDAVELFGGNYSAGTAFSPFIVFLARQGVSSN